jgi:hypothetical protein
MPFRELSFAPGPEWREGDIVQLTSPADPGLEGCFLVVTEPGPAGGLGFLAIVTPVGRKRLKNGLCYYEAAFSEGVLCGRAAAVPDAFSVEEIEEGNRYLQPPPRVQQEPGEFYRHRWGSSADLDQADSLGRRP